MIRHVHGPAQLALIGCGRMGQNHLDAAISCSSANLRYVVDPIAPPRALPVGCTRASVDTVLSDSRVAGVIIAAPTHLHADLVTSALKASKHVLCEKPLTLSTARDLELATLAGDAGLILQVGFWRRFAEPYKRLRISLASSAIGTVSALRLSQWDAHLPSLDFCRADISGGIEIDCGVHEFDLARWLLDADVAHISGCGPTPLPALVPLGDTHIVQGLGSLTTGVTLAIDLVRTAGFRDSLRAEIVGEAGALITSFDVTGTIALRSGENVAKDRLRTEDVIAGALVSQLEAFVAGIEGGAMVSDAAGGIDSAAALTAAIALRDSRFSKQRDRMPPLEGSSKTAPSSRPSALQERSIRLGPFSVPYYFGTDCVAAIAQSIAGFGADRYIVVTDDTVLDLHGRRMVAALSEHASVTLLSAPAGEAMKNQSQLASHVDDALASGATRRSIVVALGGGVPGNLAGMVAGTLFRGLRLIHIPTTFVAAMDSVISAKQAINSRLGKNQIGLYLPPAAIFVDFSMLATLPDREMRAGLAEAVKNALAIRPSALPEIRRRLTAGPNTTRDAMQWLLDDSLAAKRLVMDSDWREHGPGLLLEYGHTVGHALEHLRLGGGQFVSHGEAVAVGMLAAGAISHSLGHMSEAILKVHDHAISLLALPPTVYPQPSEVDSICRLVMADNKRGWISSPANEPAMVLLSDLGRPVGAPLLPLTPVPLDAIRAGLHIVIRNAPPETGSD